MATVEQAIKVNKSSALKVVTKLSRVVVFHYIYKTITKALWLLIFEKYMVAKKKFLKRKDPLNFN